MSWNFLDEDAAGITTQWMDGDILVAPIVHNNSKRHIYLPRGVWYSLKSEITQVSLDGRKKFVGPQHIDSTVAFDELPAFVRAGTVLPLAPVVQYTDALPGGPLDVQVYAGADGYFDFFEDDGNTRLSDRSGTCHQI